MREEFRLRLLIVSQKGKLTYSTEFAEALRASGVETLCTVANGYVTLSDFKILRHIPFPKLLGLIKEFNPDLTFTDSSFFVPNMAKMGGQPLILYLRGDIWAKIAWDREMSPLYHPLHKRMLFEWRTSIVSRALKKADVIYAISNWLEKQVKQHLPNHLSGVLYKGIKPEFWNPKCKVKSFDLRHPAVIILFDLNHYLKIMGLEEFIKCVRRMPEANFYFAGGGPYLNCFRKRRLQNLSFLGRIPHSKVKEFLAAGDVFAYPSGWDSLGTVVMEASLMEKPIVASNIGGIPEVMQDEVTGYLCRLDDTEDWVEKMRFLLDNPSVGKKLGRNARKYVTRKFNWNRIAQGFLEKMKPL